MAFFDALNIPHYLTILIVLALILGVLILAWPDRSILAAAVLGIALTWLATRKGAKKE